MNLHQTILQVFSYNIVKCIYIDGYGEKIHVVEGFSQWKRRNERTKWVILELNLDEYQISPL